MRYNPFESPLAAQAMDYAVPLTGEYAPYAAIHTHFSATPHGVALANAVRYERYKPEDTDNREWTKRLGPDVNNLGHMWETLSLAARFIEATDALAPHTYTSEQKDLLLTAAVTHDWAEAVVGDITYSQKTTADAQKEDAAFANMLDDYNGPARTTIARACAEIIFNDDFKQPLPAAFNAVERIGYMQTALRAMHSTVHDQSTTPELRVGMHWLAADVVKNQISPLMAYAAWQPATKQYLHTNTWRIDQTVAHADTYGFHPDDDATVSAQAYANARACWRTFSP